MFLGNWCDLVVNLIREYATGLASERPQHRPAQSISLPPRWVAPGTVAAIAKTVGVMVLAKSNL